MVHVSTQHIYVYMNTKQDTVNLLYPGNVRLEDINLCNKGNKFFRKIDTYIDDLKKYYY